MNGHCCDCEFCQVIDEDTADEEIICDKDCRGVGCCEITYLTKRGCVTESCGNFIHSSEHPSCWNCVFHENRPEHEFDQCMRTTYFLNRDNGCMDRCCKFWKKRIA